MLSCDEIGERLSGYLDRELTQQENQKIELHLRACGDCRDVLQRLRQVSSDVRGLDTVPTLDQEQWDRMSRDSLARGMETLGWSFLLSYVACVAALAVFATREFLLDPGVPLIVKILSASAFLGFSLLFGAVLRQRLLVYKTDKYRKVKI